MEFRVGGSPANRITHGKRSSVFDRGRAPRIFPSLGEENDRVLAGGKGEGLAPVERAEVLRTLFSLQQVGSSFPGPLEGLIMPPILDLPGISTQ